MGRVDRAEALALQFAGDAGDVFALEAGDRQFLFRRLSAAIAGNGGGAIRAATADFAGFLHFRYRIRYADYHHAVMEQRGVERGNSGFLAAMLRRR